MKASAQSCCLLTALQFAAVNPGARPPFQRRCYWEAPAPSVSPQTRGSVQPNANASQGRSAPKAGEGAGEGHAAHQATARTTTTAGMTGAASQGTG